MSFFDAYANQWWKSEGPFAMLHKMNPHRIALAEDVLNGEIANKKWLDIGCGGGIFTEKIALIGGNIVGIDESKKSIEQAISHKELMIDKKLHLEYKHMSFHDFYQTQQRQSFDVICAFEVLEHMQAPEKALEMIAQLLKPGGYFIASTIAKNLKSYLAAIVAAEYILKWVPIGTHEYEKFIAPSELIAMGRKFDLDLVRMLGLKYDFIAQDFIHGEDVSVNYMLALRKV